MSSRESQSPRMSTFAVFLLWSGIAVSVAEIWAGSLLGDAGLVWGLVIIVAGHIFGGVVLSAAGCIGCRYRVTAMQSTRLVLGNRGSVIPSLLNVLQLVGWATIMLALSGAIGADAGQQWGGIFARREFWIVLIGIGTLAWSLIVGESRFRWVHNLVIVGLLALAVLLSWIALNPQHYHLSGPYLRPLSLRNGMVLMDLVIAMPISWVPLIADYSRLARNERGAFWGSFIGYGLVSSWMYAIGLIVFLATNSTDPAANVVGVMSRLGLAFPAMILVFASTVTSDFPDIYSSACSLLNVNPRIKPVYTMWGTGLLTIVLALFFDLSRYENFLLAVGAFFVPLFALLLTDYFLIHRQQLSGMDFVSGAGLEYVRGFRPVALIIWGIGTGVFFLAQHLEFCLGGSITSFLATAVLHLATTWRPVILLRKERAVNMPNESEKPGT